VKTVRENISSKLGLRVMSVAVVLLGLSVTSQAQLVFDNFDEYTNNQVLATTTLAAVPGSPWGRFGSAIADNPIAKTGTGVGGSVAMDVPLNYVGGNNAQVVYYFSSGSSNLTSVSALTIDMKVSTALAANTIVAVAEEQADGGIYQTTATFSQVLTNTNYQTFTLALNTANMSKVAGGGAITFDLTQVKDLRIRFQNVTGGGSQLIYVDNFQAIPEPSTLALMVSGICLGLGMIRRRRS
jgi:hypothetical protein